MGHGSARPRVAGLLLLLVTASRYRAGAALEVTTPKAAVTTAAATVAATSSAPPAASTTVPGIPAPTSTAGPASAPTGDPAPASTVGLASAPTGDPAPASTVGLASAPTGDPAPVSTADAPTQPPTSGASEPTAAGGVLGAQPTVADVPTATSGGLSATVPETEVPSTTDAPTKNPRGNGGLGDNVLPFVGARRTTRDVSDVVTLFNDTSTTMPDATNATENTTLEANLTTTAAPVEVVQAQSAAGGDQQAAGSTSTTETADTSAASTNDTASSTTSTTESESTARDTNGTDSTASEATASNTTLTASNVTEAASNATDTTTDFTTTEGTTTTEAPPNVIAVLPCKVEVINMPYESWMGLKITRQNQEMTTKIISALTPALRRKFGDYFLDLEVVKMSPGSDVVIDVSVTIQTNESNAADVDKPKLAAETTLALQMVVDSGELAFDPESAEASEEFEVLEPTTTPGPTENPYEFTLIDFVMRAPNANYSVEMNDSNSEIFAEMDKDADEGIREMLRKKYPPGEWNVSATLTKVWNDTDKGLWIQFVVSISPQWANTSTIVTHLGKQYVFFSRFGSLQIDPASVNTKDLTKYAPGLGVVVMDEDYRRELRKSLYNGSYVGDYTTPRPTLRPIVKRHKSYVMGIALPAFLGMLAALGLLLICTTIAGAKKAED